MRWLMISTTSILKQIYGADVVGEARYSPAKWIGCEKQKFSATRTQSTLSCSQFSSPAACAAAVIRRGW